MGLSLTIDDLPPIDVRRLARRAGKSPSYGGELQWTSGSKASYQLWRGFADRTGLLVLRWSVQGRTVEIPARLVATVPRFGGLRWWVLCPRCQRRCACLAMTQKADGVACRVCMRLGYQSQIIGECQRTMEGCRAIRRRYGGTANLFEPWWEKPPRMHWATWDRIKEREEAYRSRALALAMARGGVR